MRFTRCFSPLLSAALVVSVTAGASAQWSNQASYGSDPDGYGAPSAMVPAGDGWQGLPSGYMADPRYAEQPTSAGFFGQPTGGSYAPQPMPYNYQRGPAPPPGTFPEPFTAPSSSPVTTGYGEHGPPDGMRPWPETSPFDHRFQQHVNEDGLWKRITNDGRNKTFFNIDGQVYVFTRPKAQIGSPVGAKQAGIRNPSMGNSKIDRLFRSGGLRGQWGFFRPDDSGFALSGWWSGYRTVTGGSFQLPATVAFNSNTGGSTIAFDSKLQVGIDETIAGSTARWYFTPWRQGESWKLRPIGAIRFMAIREGFSVLGLTSSNQKMSIDSVAHSYLIGPEAGLRFDVGGKNLKLISETSLAVTGNIQRFTVRDKVVHNFHQINTASAAPIFNQRLHMQMNIFPLVPVLNRMHALENARFRFGVSYFALGDILRPAQSIVYRPPSQGSFGQVNRNFLQFWTWDFGVNWRF